MNVSGLRIGLLIVGVFGMAACATGRAPSAKNEGAFVDARALFSDDCIVTRVRCIGDDCEERTESGGLTGAAVAGAVIDAGVDAAAGLAKYLGEAAQTDPVTAIANVEMMTKAGEQNPAFNCLIFVHGEFAQDGKARDLPSPLRRRQKDFEEKGLPLIGAPDVYLEAQVVMSDRGTAFQIVPLYSEYNQSPTRRFRRSKTRSVNYTIEMKSPSGNTLAADSFATGVLSFDDVKPGYVYNQSNVRYEPTPMMPVSTSSGGTVTAVVSVVERREGSRFFAALSSILNDDVQSAIKTDVRQQIVGLNATEITTLDEARSNALTKCFAAENAQRRAAANRNDILLRQAWQSAHFDYVVAMRSANVAAERFSDSVVYKCDQISPY